MILFNGNCGYFYILYLAVRLYLGIISLDVNLAYLSKDSVILNKKLHRLCFPIHSFKNNGKENYTELCCSGRVLMNPGD